MKSSSIAEFTSIRRVERKLQLWFLGPCDPFSQSLKKEIAHSLVLTLKHNGLCEDRGGIDILSYLSTLCDPEVLEVNCGQRSLGRGRRSAASLVNIEVTLQENARLVFGIRYGVEMVDGFISGISNDKNFL